MRVYIFSRNIWEAQIWSPCDLIAVLEKQLSYSRDFICYFSFLVCRREATIFWMCDAPHPLWPVLFSSPSECWLICIWSTGTAGVCGVLHGSTEQTRELKARASVHTHVWCSSLWVVWWFRFYDVKIMKCAVNQGLQAAYWNMHDFAIISNPLSYTNPYFMWNIKVGWFFVMPVGSQRFVVTKILYENPLKEKKKG